MVVSGVSARQTSERPDAGHESHREAVPAHVVNLCFHGIGEPGRALEPDEWRYWITLEQFEEILRTIRPFPAVRIMFDDGNRSDATNALPALIRHGLRASFFVVAGRLNSPGSLTDQQLRDLVGAGMTVGSHGMRHRSFRALDDQSLHEETVAASRLLSDAIGKPVDQLALPFGAYDRHVLRSLRRLGLARVYTVDGGPARSEAWLQSRHVIRSTDGAETLLRLLQRVPARAHAPLRTAKGALKRWR